MREKLKYEKIITKGLDFLKLSLWKQKEEKFKTSLCFWKLDKNPNPSSITNKLSNFKN